MNGAAQGAFRALADPTRRAILMKLSHENLSIGTISDQFPMTRAAVKKHLNILEEGGLLSVHINGRERINCLRPEGIKSAFEWIQYFDRFWDGKLGKLQEVVEKEEKSNSKEKEK
ncbi:MAG: winged helix-turn-helix transcriptional regulator [Rhizobiales bacterium]|nr:winged helix-turn-helix transcriptional regulator [Hyphomicrobiales bacterium]